jgi:hypothetical protein
MAYNKTNNDAPELIEKVVYLNRVSKTVKGGRVMKFSALVVVGDGKGTVGYGLGKAAEVSEAILKGIADAKKNMVKVSLAGTTIPLPKEKTADGKLDAYVGKTLKVGIRPEDIKDDEEFLEKHSTSHLNAEVEVSELMGAEIYLYLTYQGQNLMARVAPTSKARNGDTVRVAFDPHKVHLFDIETEQTILN